MSAYLMVIIPYNTGVAYSEDDYFILCSAAGLIPELEQIESEFIEDDLISLAKDFIIINTCYRMSALMDNENGYSRIRVHMPHCKSIGSTGSVVCRGTLCR